MKNLLLTLLVAFVSCTIASAQGVGINADGSEPDSSAILHVKSSEQGMLIPSMTEAERDAISGPATGLLVFQTSPTKGFFFNKGTPATPAWNKIGGTAQSEDIPCETRTPIDTIPFTISESGSYFVTKNLKGQSNQNGITIASSNVTLDLNGFTLTSGGGTSGDGIFVSSFPLDSNLYIYNGNLVGWGDEGLNANSARNSRFENLTAIKNQADGILTGRNNMILGCAAMDNGVDGIDGDFSCVIRECMAMGNGDNGIESNSGTIIQSSTSYQNRGNGINTSAGCTVLDCASTDNKRFGFNLGNSTVAKRNVATLNDSSGFFAAAAVLLEGNTSRLNDGHGFRASTDSYLLNNISDQNDFSGFRIVTSDIRIDGNQSTDNGGYGYQLLGTGGSILIRNSASGNVFGGYQVNPGHFAAPIVAGGAIGTITNPYTNIDF